MTEAIEVDKNFSRDAAFKAIPVQLPYEKIEEDGEGLLVTVMLQRPRWQQWLGADRLVKRTFDLDAYGKEVYEYCNRKNTVDSIIKKFAKKHRLTVAESEVAVTQFLNMLVQKGLLAMEVKAAKSKKYKKGGNK